MWKNERPTSWWHVEDDDKDSDEEEEESLADDLTEAFDPFDDPIKDPSFKPEEHCEEQSSSSSDDSQDSLVAESEDAWVSRTVSHIRSSARLLSPRALNAHKPSHLHLRQFRKVITTLLTRIETAIDNERDMEIRLRKRKLEEMQMEMEKERVEAQGMLAEEQAKYKKVKRELADHRESALAESQRQASLLREATEQTTKQAALFEREKEALKGSHMQEKESWKALLDEQRKDLERQLEKERQKSCSACNEKPRDAVIIPCLHLDYCFECLVRHRTINSNTCPKCNGPIQGLCMSSFGASQQ